MAGKLLIIFGLVIIIAPAIIVVLAIPTTKNKSQQLFK